MSVATGTFYMYQSSARTKFYSDTLGSTNAKNGREEVVEVGTSFLPLLLICCCSFFLSASDQIPFRW